MQSTADGFVEGGLQHVDLAFQWGLKYGIGVSLDLHAANGSQNGYDHSAPTVSPRDASRGYECVPVPRLCARNAELAAALPKTWHIQERPASRVELHVL